MEATPLHKLWTPTPHPRNRQDRTYGAPQVGEAHEDEPVTEDIRRYRGDWLIEALTAIARQQGTWTPIPTKPLNMSHGTPGRFHAPTQTYWPEAREDAGADPPLMRQVRIPSETDIDYPGERLTITPTWVREVHEALKQAGCLNAFHNYCKSDSPHAIAYYSPRRHAVVWHGEHPHQLHMACLVTSDLMEYQPVPDNHPTPIHATCT